MERAEERKAGDFSRLDALLDVTRSVYSFSAKFDRSTQQRMVSAGKKLRQAAYGKSLARARARMKDRGAAQEEQQETPNRGRWLTIEEAKAKFPGVWISPN